MQGELIEKYDETVDVKSFIFKPEEKLKWKAGQFIYYKIPHKDPDGRGIIRHFTIASAPHEGNIRLTTRFTDKGGSSFKKALRSLKPGSKVEIFAHEGSFTIEDLDAKYIFIAGGIGITPIRAILLDLEEKDMIKDIILYYGTHKENIVFKDLLKDLGNKNNGLMVQYTISPKRIDNKLLQNNIRDLHERLIFISGPMKMVKKIQDSLLKGGIPVEKMKTDYFSGY